MSKRPQTAENINNRTTVSKKTKVKKPQTPVSIPSKSNPREKIEIQSQNIFKKMNYNNDHMLDQLNLPSRSPDMRAIECIQPLPKIFEKKQNVKKQDFEEFMKDEYPILFNKVNEPKQEEFNFFNVQKVQLESKTKDKNKEKANEEEKIMEISLIDEANLNQKDDNKSLQELEDFFAKIQDPSLITEEQQNYLQSILKDLKPSKQKNENKGMTLCEILGLDTPKKREEYRALPLKIQKEIKDNNLVDENFKNQVLSKKLSDFQMEQNLGQKNYFKIINDLDLLKKGARELKNKSGQTFALRKKVQEPKIERLLKEVKSSNSYLPGFSDQYQREFNLINYKNRNIDEKFLVNIELDEKTSNDLIQREVPINLNRVFIPSKNLEQNQNTELRIVNNKIEEKAKEDNVKYEESQSQSQASTSFQISAKAQQMYSLMDDIF